jgi:hypothetical protein
MNLLDLIKLEVSLTLIFEVMLLISIIFVIGCLGGLKDALKL